MHVLSARSYLAITPSVAQSSNTKDGNFMMLYYEDMTMEQQRKALKAEVEDWQGKALHLTKSNMLAPTLSCIFAITRC